MSDEVTPHPVERMFPFVLKTRALLVGRDTLRANKGKLHFVLITTDIAEASREADVQPEIVLVAPTTAPVIELFGIEFVRPSCSSTPRSVTQFW